MDRTDDQFRLMFWDGHTLFKNAMLKSADVGPPGEMVRYKVCNLAVLYKLLI